MKQSAGLTRRATLGRFGGSVAAAMTAPALIAGHSARAQEATVEAAGDPALPPEILAIIEQPEYAFSRWGIHVQDRDTGEVILDHHGRERYLAASTTKLYTTAAALTAYGADFRFETPIYRQGEVGADGVLEGDLILVASGDPTLGGRTTPEEMIDFVATDHINAVALPFATLTPQDPLAGMDDLAEQVAAAGITEVSGNVVIDDRLFPTMPKDGYFVTPIWVNDNLIDLTITPGVAGEAATLEWRPQVAAYQVSSSAMTVAAGEPLTVSVTSPGPGVIEVSGNIPADQGPLVQVFQVPDPAAFARTVLIEALNRAGVTVSADPLGSNPVDLLPDEGSYAAADRVAVLGSPPFSETIKLTNKVSHNQHADLLVMLLAIKAGETSFAAGMGQIRRFLEDIGLDPSTVSLSDGRGNEYTDLFSLHAVSDLLRTMALQGDFETYFASLPILGVDGSETDTVPPDSPVAGQARAKSGTTAAGDLMNERLLIMTRALAGYMAAASGRELIFTIYVNDVPAADLDVMLDVIHQQGTIAEIIHAQF